MFDIPKHVDGDGLEMAPRFKFIIGTTRYELGLHFFFDVC